MPCLLAMIRWSICFNQFVPWSPRIITIIYFHGVFHIWCVKVILYIVLALECCSLVLNSTLRWIQLEHKEGKIIITLGRFTMHRWSSLFLGQWLAASPGVAMLACISNGQLIDIFLSVSCMQAGLKMVLDTSLLSTQQYKVHIKGKVEQSGERSCTLSYTSV